VPLVTPCIHHQAEKDDEPQEQKHHGQRLVLPEKSKTPGDLIRVHVALTYTTSGENPSAPARALKSIRVLQNADPAPHAFQSKARFFTA